MEEGRLEGRILMNLVFVGDIHADTVSPRSRKDDYYLTLQRKLAEVKQILLSLQTPVALVLSGDIFHKQDQSRVNYVLTNYLISYFRSLADLGIPTFSAMGNHDVQSRPDRWYRQPIGTLVEAGILKPLWSNPVPSNPLGRCEWNWDESGWSRERLSTTKVCISGTMYSYAIDDPNQRDQYYSIPVRAEGVKHVHVVHGMLIPEGQTFFGGYTNPSDLVDSVSKDNLPDIYLVGHGHDDYGAFQANWKGDKQLEFMCFNPGSLMRGSVDGFNIRRQVKVLVLENVECAHTFRFVPITSAQAAEEVFFLDEIVREDNRKKELEELADRFRMMVDGTEFKVIDPVEAMEVVFKAKKVTVEVETALRGYVERSRQIF